MHEEHRGRVQPGLNDREVVLVFLVRLAREVGAHAEVLDGDIVIREMQRDERSDFPHRPVFGKSPVHLHR